MSLPPSANSRDRWLDLANEARDKAREALSNGDRRTAELWDEHERTLLRNAYENVPHPDDGAPATDDAPTGTLQDLIGTIADDRDVSSPQSLADGEGVQVAFGDESAAMAKMMGRLGPWIAGGEVARQTAQRLNDRHNELVKRRAESLPNSPPPSPGTPIPPQEMQTPGSPSKSPIPQDEWNKEEILPAEPIVVKGTAFPIGEPNKGQIFIFPDLSDEIEQIGIMENRRGNEWTQAELDAIRDHLLKLNPGWEHFRGGRDAETGKQKKEYYISNYFGGRKGANYTDLTFKGPDGELVHVQSVDADKDGNPIQRELDIAERISKRTGAKVILIPKRWQTEK